jgi:signal peptide peptidase SppA
MNTPDIWLGTDRSFADYLAKLTHYEENPQKYSAKEAHFQAKFQQDEYDSPAEYLADAITSRNGSTGIVTVDGPMSKTTSMMELIFSGSGYDAIGQAFVNLAEDESIENILMILDTPGGDANGISELSDLIKDIGRYKPVTAFASGAALSAGYWLATSANELRGSKLSELGSIGAISTFTSIAKMLESDGIETYVSRSGKYKALLNSREPISEAAKEMLDSKTQYLHSVFIDNVLQNRPSLSARAQSSWAEGQTFYFDQATSVGLIDGPPVDLAQILVKLSRSNSGDSTMKRKPLFLSESARAALQAGAELAALSEQPTEPATEQPVTDAVEPQGEVEAKAETPTETEAETATGTELKSEVSDTLTAYLQQSLKEKEGKIELLTKEKIKLEDKLESLQTVEQSLKPIAIQACQRMQVALGQNQSSFDGFSTEAIKAEYKTLQTAFNERYPAGKQSISETEESQAPATNSLTSRLELIHGGQQ